MRKTVKSKLGGALNVIAREIKGVAVENLGETNYDGEIITIEFKDGTIKHINTATNVISNSLKQVRTKTKTNCKLQNGRLTTVIYVGGYNHGTRVQLGTLVGLAKDFLNNIVPDSYIGKSINHIDRTGNISIYGYINNKLYNLETTSDSNNSRQWRCVKRVQDVLNIHIGLSANNDELLDIIEFVDDSKLMDELANRFIIANVNDKVNNKGTIYIQ
jgi:hypothetical protein